MYSIPNPHLVGWHASWVSWLCCTFYIFTRATLASTGINCHYMSVCPSVTSRCSSETDKCRITQTMPDNSPGTLVFWCWKSWQHSNGVTPNGGAKCRWGTCGSWKLATFDMKHCHLSSVTSLSHWASTLFVCSTFPMMQHLVWVCQQQLILVTFCLDVDV